MDIVISTQPTCEKCQFFVPEGATAGQVGRCYRYPRQRSVQPEQNDLGQIRVVESSNFPMTRTIDWCGEFKLAEMPLPAGNS